MKVSIYLLKRILKIIMKKQIDGEVIMLYMMEMNV